jgi:hypothetical protein
VAMNPACDAHVSTAGAIPGDIVSAAGYAPHLVRRLRIREDPSEQTGIFDERARDPRPTRPLVRH